MTEPLDFELIAGMLDAYVESIKEHGGAMLDRWHYVPQVEGAAEDLRAFALSASPAPAEPVQQRIAVCTEGSHEELDGHCIHCGVPVIRVAEPVQQDVHPIIATAPKHIWLDIGEAMDWADEGDTFRDLKEVTWSEDDAAGGGIKYVRADLATPHPVQPEEAVARDAAPLRIPRGEADYALMNRVMELSCEAASANAKANSDDGHAGTEASARFIELRRQIWTLIASVLSRQQDAGGAKG